MQAATQHVSPLFQAKRTMITACPPLLKSAYEVSRNIFTLKIIAAFPCGAEQP